MSYQYISFNPLRSIGIPSVKYIKPEKMFQHINELKLAEHILFPEYWQVNSLVYALKKDIFPSISTYHLGHDKIEMTRSLTALCPSKVPKTGIFSKETVLFESLAEQFGLPFVCKEIRSSSGLGVFLIRSYEDFRCYIKGNAIVYIQEYLEIDRDLRVVVIGDQVVSSYWRIRPPGCFHNNIARGGKVDRENVPKSVVEDINEIARVLRINYAGFDVAITKTGTYLIEFNVFFGTSGIELNSAGLGNIVHQYLQKRNSSINCFSNDLSMKPQPSEHTGFLNKTTVRHSHLTLLNTKGR